jgi:membrane protein implicated in regulation of membrane protease activity
MAALVDFLLVGRTPLGSAIRGVLIALLLWQFWRLVLAQIWTQFLVSLITALVVVVAAHFFSRRDNPASDPLARGDVRDPDI